MWVEKEAPMKDMLVKGGQPGVSPQQCWWLGMEYLRFEYNTNSQASGGSEPANGPCSYWRNQKSCSDNLSASVFRPRKGGDVHMEMDNPPTKAKPRGEAPSIVPERK
jgi:hypothetical protein